MFRGVSISYNNYLDVVDTSPEESKLTAVKNQKIPENEKSCQSILGMCMQLSLFYFRENKEERFVIPCSESTWKATEDLKTEFKELKLYLKKG